MNEYEYNEYTYDALQLHNELVEAQLNQFDVKTNFLEECIAIFKKYDDNVREERIRFIQAKENRLALCLSDYERFLED